MAFVASRAEEECFDDLGVSGNGESAPSAVNKSVSQTNMMRKKAPNTASMASLAEKCLEDLGDSLTRRRENPVAKRSLMRAYKSGERKDKESGLCARDRVRGPVVVKGDMGGYRRGRTGYEAAIGNRGCVADVSFPR
jgi:hypothetical protein